MIKESLYILVVALVLRIATVVLIGEVHHPQLWEFGDLARHVIAGEGFSLSHPTNETVLAGNLRPDTVTVPSAYMPPAYVWLMAGLMWILGAKSSTYLFLLLLQCIFGALSAVLLYQVSLILLPAVVARIAGYICAFYPPFLYAVTDFGPTVLFTLVLSVFWLGVCRLVRFSTLKDAVLAGSVAPLMGLMRAESLILVLGVVLWLAIRGWRRAAVVIFSMLVLGITPWTVRNYLVFHRVVPLTTSVGLNFWRGHNGSASGTGRSTSGEGIWGSPVVDGQVSKLQVTRVYEIQRDEIYLNDAMHFVREHPIQEIVLSAKKAFFLWILDITHPLARSLLYILSWGTMLVFFLVGSYISYVRGYHLHVLILHYVGMTVIAMLFFVLPRLQIILAYGVVPISSLGIVWLSRMVGRTRQWQRTGEDELMSLGSNSETRTLRSIIKRVH